MLGIKKETVSLTTSDGIRLDADIYRPETTEKLPILLMRQPYGRAIASTVVYAHPHWYASQGYIVVIQDVRGRGSSEGEFKLFANEVADGIETINWLAKLPGSTGEIGMYGFSYQGMTQLYAATGESKALKAIAPAMVGYDLYTDWAYENGAFCLYANLGWAIQLAAETARRKGDEVAYQKLYAAARNLPLSDRLPANPDLMQEVAKDSFYHDWLANEQPNEYWQQLSPKYLLDNVDLPMLHIGGWFDPYLRGTLNLYEAMAKRAKTPQHLIVAPWAHLPWGQKLGAMDYGIEAQNYIDEIQIRWFDHFLKGKDTGLLAEASISLFEMGSNQWLELDKFPEAIASYYLASNGLAATKLDSGMLWEYEKEVELNSSDCDSSASAQSLDLDESVVEGHTEEFANSIDFIVHDPWRPVPALGGHASFPGGSSDRSSLDCRADILTYTSDVLAEDLSIVGIVTIELYCQVDQPSFDLCAVLSEVHPDGRVFNFTQGYIKIDDLQNPVTIPLQATCMKIAKGSCLRLSLSGACFPAYAVNSGTGKTLVETQLIEQQVITISVLSGADYPSLLSFKRY